MLIIDCLIDACQSVLNNQIQFKYYYVWTSAVAGPAVMQDHSELDKPTFNFRLSVGPEIGPV